MTAPIRLVAEALSSKPVDVLDSLGVQLGCLIRVCLDAGQLSEEQAREILRRIPRYAGLDALL